MQLTSVLLYQSLKKQFRIADYRLPSPEQPLARPFFYESGQPLDGNHIYLTDQILDLTFFRTLPEDVVFIICQKNPASMLPEGSFSALLLSCDTPLTHVFNRIQAIFDHYEHWEAELVSICQRGGALAELLDVSVPIFHNPLCISGVDWVPAAASGMEEVPDIQKILTDSSLRIRYANAFSQDQDCQLPPDQKTPVLFPDHITGHRSLNINLFTDGQADYRLIVIEHQSALTEADHYLITILAQHAEYVLRRIHSESSTRNTTLQSIFQTILSDRSAEYLSTSKLLSAVGWMEEHTYFCAVFRSGGSGLVSLNPKAVCQYLQETFPASCSLIFKEQAVCFFNLVLLDASTDDICQKLVYFIRDSFLKAGYSRAMKGHMNLRRQYLQAQTALLLGCELHPQLWIHPFSHVALPYILREAVKTFPGSMLCYEQLLRLQESDRSLGTEYMKTLKVYLDHNLNTVQSAKSLYIHRSTFLYRLERIKRILETDLEDPEELFYLNLSFRLLEQP